MTNIDTRNLDALAGAVYFTVGRGTEGGSASYRLSVAGVDRSEWGQPGAVAANSGYSIGTIQVDLGQRGTWPLGATTNRALGAGETTYVDGIIGQAADYARRNGLTFPEDTTQLRADLLTHGNGRSGRDTISFIDPAVRDSINTWAASDEGKRWIHSNIDYPQVRNATQTAMTILDRSGSNISEDRRFEAINILAKTANQYPRGLDRLENVLREGGDYNALQAEAQAIRGEVSYYDGPKAASVAQTYEDNYAADPNRRAAMDRAHAAVARPDYDPSTERNNADVQQSLGALPGGAPRRSANTVLEEGASGREVRKLESNLAGLGYSDTNGRALAVDERFTAETRQAVENYQRAAQLPSVDGRAGPQTLGSIDQTVRGLQQNLTTLGINRADGQPIGVDGYYGNGTREAVRTFQQNNGLDPTGISDEATRRAIETAVRERTQTAPTDAVPAQPGTATPTRAGTDIPAQPVTGTPTPAATGPQSFEDVMRVMLPPQNSTTPHMTSDFGPRSVVGGSSNHQGVDFNYVGGQNGTNLQHPTVHSPVSGVVVYGEGQGTYGTVKIRDDQGNMHEILHLDSRSVRATDPPTRIEAGDPIGTMGGRGPEGASQYAQHVHYQVRDPNNNLIDPEAYWNNPQRRQGQDTPAGNVSATPNAPSASTDPLANGTLERNERGDPVYQLQQNLVALGVQFRDQQGQPIAPTGFYGEQTEAAVRNFQSTHHLPQTGTADETTRSTIEAAVRERTQGTPTENAPAQTSPPPNVPGNEPTQTTAPPQERPAQMQAPTQASAPPNASNSEAMADNVLRRGESGPEVGHYQRILADLGYRGADGKPLQVDEKFGPNTESAAKQFQRDHGIEPLGVIGPMTRAAAEEAGRELMTHADNPNNALYKTMLEKVHGAEDGRNIPHGEHSRNVAAALTVEALRERMTDVDRVDFSRDGSMARAVQFSQMGDKPELNRNTDGLATQQAVRQPIAESSEQLEQVANNVRTQQREERQPSVAQGR